MFSETHAHLYRYTFPSVELDETIRQAEENGVNIILNAGVDLETSIKAVKIAQKYSSVYACVGVHPWFANSFDDMIYEMLLDLTKEKKVVGISEIGLDFVGRREAVWAQERAGTGNYLPKTIQIKTFTEQLKLAKKVNLPVILHHNNSHREVLETLRHERGSEIEGVIHGFFGDLETAKKYLDLGFYISIGKRSILGERIVPKDLSSLINVIEEIPVEKLLIETDSGTPAEVKDVAKKIAEFKGISFEKVGKITTSNIKKLLGI